MKVIEMRFPNDKWARAFWGWYLDGGGEDGCMDALEDRCRVALGSTFSDWDFDEGVIAIAPSDKELKKLMGLTE